MSFSSEFSLGGTNRKVATAAMGRNKRLRIPPAELKDAVLQFSKNLLLIPVQVDVLCPLQCSREPAPVLWGCLAVPLQTDVDHMPICVLLLPTSNMSSSGA